MIDSRELRRGNLIRNKSKTNDYFNEIVSVIDIFGESGLITTRAVESGYVEHRRPIIFLKGIPLTPDILEKCPDVVWKYGTTFFIGKLKFTYEKNELSEFVRFHFSGKVVYLQYLHELQNLCYALKTELTITL